MKGVIIMRKSMNKTRTIAGILSLAMLTGAVSAVPINSYAVNYGEKQTNEDLVMTCGENNDIIYELKNVSVYEVKDLSSLIVIPRSKNGRYYYYNRLRIDFSFDDNDLLSTLEKGMVVNLKFKSAYLYSEIEELLNEIDSGSVKYEVDLPYYGDISLLSCKIAGEHYYGDINDDDIIDAFDLIMYKQHIEGTLDEKLTQTQFGNGDINHDDVIDENDYIQVSDYVLGKVKKFNSSSPVGSIRLDNTVDILKDEGRETDSDFAAAQMAFGVDMMKKCFNSDEEKKNLLVSPLSVSTVLSMTANGADGETRDEMEKVLGNGLSLETINEYYAYYTEQLPDNKDEKVLLSNSLWFKDKPTFKVLEEYLETNRKYYGSEIFKTMFNADTATDINSWVNDHTNGMIPKIVDKNQFEEENNTAMMLINTLYFEAEWSKKYTVAFDGEFTDINGIKHTIEELRSQEDQYFDLGNADAFKKPYVNGNYSFIGILPREDNIEEYVESLDAQKLMEDLNVYTDPTTFELNVMIPKFKYNYNISLNDILKDMGISTAFDKESADFTKIYDKTAADDDILYIDEVLHKTRIEVTEKGTKAAAVSSVMMGLAAGIPEEKKKIQIYLDRPFVYMIVDKNNVPLFMGVAVSLEK